MVDYEKFDELKKDIRELKQFRDNTTVFLNLDYINMTSSAISLNEYVLKKTNEA